MNKNIKIYIIIGIVIIILCILKIPNFIVKGLSGELSYKYSVENIVFRLFEDKEEKIINSNELKNYLNNTYKKISTDFNIDYMGVFSNSNIRGVHGWYYRSWIRAYEISTPFMSKPFEVWIDNRTHKIFGDNFYDTLKSDKKFQHLYSDWVKKQIGINDPNVELIMIFNNSIDFLNIKNKDNILEELFNNIVEYKVTNAYVKNVGTNNETDLANYANNIHDIYFTFKKYNEESSGEFNLNDSVILIKEDINFLDKNVRKLGRYLDFPWNIDEKIIEFKDGKIVKIYQH